MAYGVKYRFPFQSVDGVDWTIDILKNGYSGSVLTRSLGGSPILRKDKNDNICGTSLELVAECRIDGEFEEFYTNDPLAYKVNVYHSYNGSSSALVWQGFITPEMYSAPDISPRYDVRITATDGLGELKLNNFEAQGRKSISALLDYLLGFTGLSLSYRHVNDISGSTEEYVSINDYNFLYAQVNLDYLIGETCYDVLQALLASIHSNITLDGNIWLIFKETGISINSANSTYRTFENTADVWRPILHYGSMRTHSFWPVGYMSREYVAPKNRMVLTSDNHYIPDLLGTWTLNGSTTDEGSYWNLPGSGDGLTQTVTFTQKVFKHLVLSIKVRNVGSGQDAGTIGVKVEINNGKAWLTQELVRRRLDATNVGWRNNPTSICSFDVQAPVDSDTDQDYVAIDVVLPLYYHSLRDNIGANSLNITISNGDSLYPKRIYGISLCQYEQMKGFKKIVSINNGARGEGSDVDVSFAGTTGANNYRGLEELVYGVPMASNAKITSWNAGSWSGLDYLSLISRDYALSIAQRRIRVTGTLETNPTNNILPVLFIDDHDSVPYIVETFSWDLYNDEITVDMISLPTSSMNISAEATDESTSENTTAHAQAQSSSSGGSYTLPTASASTLGGIKVGSGLSIDANGVLSSSGGSAVTVTNYGSSTTGKIATVDNTDIYNDVAWGTYDSSLMTVPVTINGTTRTLCVSGYSGYTLSSPILYIYKGFTNLSPSVEIDPILMARHPLVSAGQAQFVLMMYSKRRGRKGATSTKQWATVRNGWGEARGKSASSAGKVFGTSGLLLSDLRYWILNNYICIKGEALPTSMTYATYQAKTGPAGFGRISSYSGTDADFLKKTNRSRLFGIAVRMENPEWANVASANPAETTREIFDSNTQRYIRRYLYSVVQPFRVMCNRTYQGWAIGIQLEGGI